MKKRLVKFIAVFMAAYIFLLAAIVCSSAVVDVSRGDGSDYNLTASSVFPLTVGFAFRNNPESTYNYITATEVGGYGQEWFRTSEGTDEFTYIYDELGSDQEVTRELHYVFGSEVDWMSDNIFGNRYGLQEVNLGVTTQGSTQAVSTIVLRAQDTVFNVVPFYLLKQYNLSAADYKYAGIPLISSPDVIDPSTQAYIGMLSISYTTTDQYGNTKDLDYSIVYDSRVNDFLPLLNVDDLKTYYEPEEEKYSSKIVISNYKAFWDVNYYEYVEQTAPEPDEDALSGTWLMNMFPTDINPYNWQSWEQSVNFSNGNGTFFTGIKQIYDFGDIDTYYNASGTWLWVAGDGYLDDYNRYLTFTSSAEDVSVTFLAWLQANATKQTTIRAAEPTENGSWELVDSDSKNYINLYYPLYDTSNNTDTSGRFSYPDVDNFLAGSKYFQDQDDLNVDFTSWISTAVGGFLNTELWPQFSIAGILGILVSFSIVIWFLKVFAGG